MADVYTHSSARSSVRSTGEMVPLLVVTDSGAGKPPQQRTRQVYHPESPTTPLWRKLMFKYFDAYLASPEGIQPSDAWELTHEYQSSVTAAKLRALYARNSTSASQAVNGWRLARAIVAMEWHSLTVSGLLALMNVAVSAAEPFALFSLLSHMMVQNTRLALGTICAHLFVLYVLHVLKHGVMNRSQFHSLQIKLRVSTALQALIFDTSITSRRRQPQQTHRQQQGSDDKKRIADVVNLYSIDTGAIAAMVSYVHTMWSRPMMLAIETAILVLVLASRATVLLTLMALLMLVQLAGQVLVDYTRNVWSRRSATRLNLVHECFKGILMVKLNAWESKFRAKLEGARRAEHGPHTVFRSVNAVTEVLDEISTELSLALFFAVLAAETATLTVAQVFTAFILADSIKHRLKLLLLSTIRNIRGVAAMRSVDAYLVAALTCASRLHGPTMPRSTSASASVKARPSSVSDIVASIERACFTDGSADGTRVLLADVNVHIRRGELVVICGAVGSGKSTLLRALLGDAPPLYGDVAVAADCRIAYCAQEPWLQTLSIRDNIVFGAPFDADKYRCVLDACCLLDDLEMLAHGDATRVGPKGVNLSGGQKSRIALARACYADADLLILDCPLASVDAIVQSDIFRKCFVDLLRFKTVVLVSHNPEVAASEFVDQVFTVSDAAYVDVRDWSIPHGSRRVCAFEQTAPWKRAPSGISKRSEVAIRGLNLWQCAPSSPITATAAIAATDESSVQVSARAASTGAKREWSEIKNELVTLPAQVRLCLAQRTFWFPMALSITAALLCGTALAAKDLWLVAWISSSNSDTSSHDASVAGGTKNAAVYGALVALGVIASVFEYVMTSLAYTNVANRLLDAMVQALLRAPMSFFYETQVGEILKRFFIDMAIVDFRPLMYTSYLLRHATRLCFQVAVIWYFMGFAGAFVALAVGYAVVYMFPVEQSFRVMDPDSDYDSQRLNFISEAMDGAASISAFGPNHVERFRVQHAAFSDTKLRSEYFEYCFNSFLLMRATHINGVLLGILGLMLVLQQQHALSPAQLGLTLHYLLQVEDSILGVATGIVHLLCSLPMVHRVCEFVAIEPESRFEVKQTVRVPQGWPHAGAIVFERVNFSYSGRDLALRDLSFAVTGGEKVGVIGRTGSGKSSFAMALLRLHPLVQGRILIDGVDIARLDLQTLRRSLCVIPQAPMFYRCSVRHYLDPFNEFADAELWRAVHQCGLRTNVTTLSAELSDDGENWSLGERQALCFARALLRPSRVLVLDESFSALDQDREAKLLALLDDVFAHATVFLITHRLDQVLQFDKIMVFERGVLREFGSAEELVSDPNSAFYEFLETTLLTL